MQNDLNKVRFSVKPLKVDKSKVVELARTVGIHPLAYQELPFDPDPDDSDNAIWISPPALK